MEFEFLTASDKPALLGLTSPQYAEDARLALQAIGYKVHAAFNHGDFMTRFTRVPYQVVILEELFDAGSIAENLTLQNLQSMPMNQRRHAVVILIGDGYQTFDPMQAFALSVHAVVSRIDTDKLSQVIQQTISDNDLFMSVYRETSLRVAQGKG